MNLLYQKNIYFIDIMSGWLGNINANRFKQIYLQGFLDISGGDLTLRNGGVTVNGNTNMYSTLNNYSYDNNNFNTNICKIWKDSLLTSTPNIFQGISISANGQYQVAITKHTTNYNGNIYISNNYGASNSWRDTNTTTINKDSDNTIFNQISISKTGQYITAIVHPIRNSDRGNIYLSNDYGSSWSIKNPVSSGFMQSVSLSYTGQYQTIVTYGFNNNTISTGYIYTSNNYGNSWTNQFFKINGFQSVAISATGQYQVTVQCGTSGTTTGTEQFGNIYYSNNYGTNWNDSQTRVNNYNSSLSPSVLSNYELSQTVAISYDGKYQTVLNINNGGNILINSNYGSGIWTDTNQRSPDGANGFLVSVAMSSTGQYQVVSTYNNSPTSLGTYSSILLSTNYGLPGSWSIIQNNTILLTLSNYSNTFHSLAISANANYISGVARYYTGGAPNNIGGNVYTSSLYSSLNNNVSLQYFGSNNGGNISANHPFAISLANSFSNGIYMGYDLATDGAYINSLDSYGSKNLYLQSQGGFLGIGNVFPQYTLDISGNFNVIGNTYLQSTQCNSITIGNSTQNYYTSFSNTNFNYSSSSVSSGFVVNSDNIILNSSRTIVDASAIILQPYSGNVSIGKSSPDYKFDVSGTVYISNVNRNLPSLIISATNSSGGIHLYNSASVSVSNSSIGIHLDTSSGRPFSNPATQILAVDVSRNTSDLIFKTATYSSSSALQNTERMRITNKGQIGIGTSTPGLPIYPISNVNDLSKCLLDISGSMRIYESVGSGSSGSSTIGSLVLQHGNRNGASSILFTGNPVNTGDLSGNDYGSITYYDNIGSYAGNVFPNYLGIPSDYTESSALVLDVGNNKGLPKYGYDNLILRSTGCTIIDTGLKTFFVNAVSIGKKPENNNYILDISGSVNTNNINVTGNITISNGITVSAGDINASNTNLFISQITSGGLITAKNGITANRLTVTGDISGNRLFLSGNIDCSGTFNANVINVTGALNLFSGLDVKGNLDTKGNLNVTKRIYVTDTTNATSLTTASITTNGGIGCREDIQVGGSIYVLNNIGGEENGNRVNTIYTEGIVIFSQGAQSANRSITLNGSGIKGTATTTIQGGTITADTILKSNGNIDCTPPSGTGDTTGWINANGGLKIPYTKRLDCSGGITTHSFEVYNTFNAICDISSWGVTINKPLDSSADKKAALVVKGGIYCDRQIYGNGLIFAKGGISIPNGSRLDVSGDINVSDGKIKLSQTSSLDASGLINANNGITASYINVNPNGSSGGYGIHIQNQTSSSSSDTGALRVRGGAGIIGNCYVGGIIDASGKITAKGGITVPRGSRLDVSGDIVTSGNIMLSQNSSLDASGLINANNGITASYFQVNPTGSSGAYGINIQNATSSSSTETGALRVMGGAGIKGNCYVGGIIDTSGNITINNKQSLILKDGSMTTSINQVNGNLEIRNNPINGNTIFYNKDPSGVVTEVLRLNYNNVISQKDLRVNGNIYINETLLSSNTFTDWNSNVLKISTPITQNNYYLIATMADFSNNTNLGGGLTIKGSIGGGTGSNTMIIDTTIITRGNSINPMITGTIQNYSSSNSDLCDIVIYYTGTSTNTSTYGSNGGNTGPQYYIYLRTNKNSGTRNIYFNLNITGNEKNPNNIELKNPTTLTTSLYGVSVIPSLTRELSNTDDVFTTTYNDIGVTRSNIILSTNSYVNSSNATSTTYKIGPDSSSSYLGVNADNLILPYNATYQVSIMCSTNQEGFTNGIYFTLESSGNATALYTSPKISYASTTYVANIILTAPLRIHMFANVSPTQSNLLTIFNFNVKRLDSNNSGLLTVNGILKMNDYLGTSNSQLLIMQNNGTLFIDNYSLTNQYISFRTYNASTVFNVRAQLFYDAFSLMNGTVLRVFNTSGLSWFETSQSDAGDSSLTNTANDRALILKTKRASGYVDNITMTPTMTTIKTSLDVDSSRTRFIGYNNSTSLNYTVFNPIVEIINNYPTSRSALNDPTTMLSLRRVGTTYECWDAVASFTLSRYSDYSTNPYSRLDINLNGSDQTNTLDPVMTFFAPSTVGGLGKVGINTTNPQYNLDVTGGSIRSNTLTLNSSATTFSITPGFNASIEDSTYVTYDIANQNGTHFFWDNVRVNSNLYLETHLYMNNNNYSFYGKASGGSPEVAFTPRDSENKTVIRYGTGGLDVQSNNGTSRMMFNDNGNVGIGTTSPSEKLDVNGTIRTNNLIFNNSTTTRQITLYQSDATNFRTNYTLSIESSILRYNANNSASHIFSTGTTSQYTNIATINSYGLTIHSGYLNAGSTQGLYFRNNDRTTNMYIKDDGNIGMGTTSPDVKLHVTGQIKATSFNATSDYRMKENVQPLSKTKSIDTLKPVEYDLSGGTHDMGFLAHEVQEDFPFLVQGEKDGDSMQALNYNGFIALLVKEVQDLKTNFKNMAYENEMLRETVKSLETKIEILETKMV